MLVKNSAGTVSEARGVGHYPGIAGFDDAEQVLKVASLVWDPIGLTWVKATQAGGVGGGGDASAANQLLGNASLASIDAKLTNPLPVSGTFFQATQPVSLADLDARILGRVKLWDGTDVALVTAAGAQVVDGSGVTQPVSGTFWQATQPVSAAALPLPAGASTEATLAAASGKLPATLGQKAMAASMSVVLASDQSTVPVSVAAAAATFKGRACTFNTPGRAGTAGQKIMSLYNTSGVTVYVSKVTIDLACTVVKAITVAPPIVRLWAVTVAPTNGTVLAKNKIGGSGASDAGVVVRGDASADGTGSATTLTATLPAGAILSQEYGPRFITGAGYEMADRMEFLDDQEIVEVPPNTGIVVFLDYVAAGQNPTTDRWLMGMEWRE